MRRSSKTYQQFIFTFGVALFLLRPFLSYLIVGYGGLSGDPLRTSQLMQRAIKKKDDHHEPEPEAAAIAEPRSSRSARPLPMRLFCNYLLALHCRLKAVSTPPFTPSIFMIVPDNHWYRSHSLFRI